MQAPLTTYTHKRRKTRVLHASSSPVKATDRDGLSVVEMAQRMRKRARQSSNCPRPGHEKGLGGSQKFLKRPKNTHTDATTPPESGVICSSSVFPLEPLVSLNDGTNNLQYQTPFNMSPVSSPTAPDSMSPVPPSRRHLSGTGSRNLKENKNIKRLASPFHSRSVSKSCSRSGSTTNSPKKKAKKPPFYIKTRTRSEANADPGENVSDEVLFPVSGSLPTQRSIKTGVCGPHLDDSSTAYLLQSLSGQDWLKPAKALSRSSFPDDYVPPGTPFQEWDYPSEPFLGGVPLQTSTPNAVKDTLRRHISTGTTLGAPDTSVPTHRGDVNTNTINSFNPRGPESSRVFSSFVDASSTLFTSVHRSRCMKMKGTGQGDPVSSPATHLPDSGQAVVSLSGMLDGLDIDGMCIPRICEILSARRQSQLSWRAYRPPTFFLALCLFERRPLPVRSHSLHLTGLKNDSPSLVQRTNSVDNSTQNTTLPSPSSGGRQTASRKRDRASTIRASDYMIKPVTSVPGSGEISTVVAALTTRTRSGTIRPVRPPVASLASGFPLAASQPCTGQRQTPSGGAYDPLVFVGS